MDILCYNYFLNKFIFVGDFMSNGKKYSQDFIIEVVTCLRDTKKSIREVASEYNVPFPTLANWFGLYRAYGYHEVLPQAFNRKHIRDPLDLESLHKYLLNNPCVRIKEIAKHYNVYPSQVCAFMKNYGYYRVWKRKDPKSD